ncbi:MAG: helix-turn-helix domain-containing protein [Bacteroidales bacterium]|nr:helix-turn-helix domain-containing protein [Bacteroidales bacterium]
MDITRIERRYFLAELNSEMLSKRITQKELGKYLGIRQSQLSLWLSGNRGMSLDNLIRISNAVKDWETRYDHTLNEPSFEDGEPEQTLSVLIKKHLKQQGMAQKTLAGRVGTSQSRISEYIRGAVVPSLGIASRICKELKIDPKLFVDACSRL